MHIHLALEHLTGQMHEAQTTYQDRIRYHDKQIGRVEKWPKMYAYVNEWTTTKNLKNFKKTELDTTTKKKDI
jgi:predicted ribonuclease toxin of YeeF-YezG toxin-antitoxin module